MPHGFLRDLTPKGWRGFSRGLSAERATPGKPFVDMRRPERAPGIKLSDGILAPFQGAIPFVDCLPGVAFASLT